MSIELLTDIAWGGIAAICVGLIAWCLLSIR